MPTLPWTATKVRSANDVHCLASMLPLTRRRDVPRFMLWTLRIRGQLAQAPGLAGYSLKAELLRARFWTLSAWESRTAMMAFVTSGRHAQMLEDMRGRLGPSRFEEFERPPNALPLDWDDAQARLRSPEP